MHHIVNVEAAIYKNGSWLLVKRGPGEAHESGILSLVGGKVDDTESSENVLEETITREVFEEVGLKIKNLQYIHSTHFTSTRSVVDIIFVCEYESGDIAITQPEEVAEAVWLSNDEVASHPDIKEWTKKYISLARERLHSPHI